MKPILNWLLENTWIAIPLAAIPLVIKLIIDYRLLLARRAVRHGLEWILLAIAELPAIITFALPSIPKGFWYYVLVMAIAGFMVMVWLWLLFDGIYNVVRNYNWWYVGSDDTEPGSFYSKDSWSEDFLRGLSLAQHIGLKLGLITIFTVTYLLLL